MFELLDFLFYLCTIPTEPMSCNLDIGTIDQIRPCTIDDHATYGVA